MTAIWTAPKTWAVGELVTASLLNTHLRDNLDFLKSPPVAQYVGNQASDYTTTSTSFTNVDGTNFVLTITPAGSQVLVHFDGTIIHSATNRIHFDVEIDSAGNRLAGDDGILVFNANGDIVPISFTRLVTGLTPNVAHAFRLQWKVSGGTATLHAGAGATNADVHPQFWVREV